MFPQNYFEKNWYKYFIRQLSLVDISTHNSLYLQFTEIAKLCILIFYKIFFSSIPQLLRFLL